MNVTSWPEPAMGEVWCPMKAPVESYKSNMIVPAVGEAFATAIPVEIDPVWPKVPEASTYVRNAVPEFALAPAWATVNAAGLSEKTTRGTGVLFPAAGVTVTEPPGVATAPAPDVRSLNE